MYQPHGLTECIADIKPSTTGDRIEFTFIMGIRSELSANAVDTGLPKIQISSEYYVCDEACEGGGWMNMENFVSGNPGCEFQIRNALTEVIGPIKSETSIVPASDGQAKFLEYFFQEEDAKFFKSLGLNCIQLHFDYRHFECDLNLRVLK
ncbi:hypothetical protein BD769DRAFT_1398511 [Suillus cothurnatus]|nr:hypothetical protein BD769DRAFT_1398511 [Suillus cothurnatus]